MMSSLSNAAPAAGRGIPVSPFDYRDMTLPVAVPAAQEVEAETEKAKPAKEVAKIVPAGPTPQEIEAMVSRARAEATAETEKRLRVEFEARMAAETAAMTAQVKKTLEKFVEDRKSYFSRVEADVVQLALSIAGKILHREAQVDPLLMTSLVRVAIEKVQDGSKVAVRVAPQKAEHWRRALSNQVNGLVISVNEDAALKPQDCILETDMGSANFSIDAQLKEIERGFFDLLAQRPD